MSGSRNLLYSGNLIGRGLPPDFARRLYDEPKLGDLLIHGESIALDGRREAALRTQAELIERNKFGRFVDPALECVLALDGAALGGHQTQHHHLALGHEPQRFETARAFVVVFEKKAVDVQSAKQGTGHMIVSARRDPRR